MAKSGFFEFCGGTFEWMITKSDWPKDNVYYKSPAFSIKSKCFGLAFEAEKADVSVCMDYYSDDPVAVSLSLHLVANDGTRKKINTGHVLNFLKREDSEEVAYFSMIELDPKFVSDGVMFRCRLEIKPYKEPEKKVFSLKTRPSLVDDLRKEINNKFCDFILVYLKLFKLYSGMC